jgi:hypothetical protein
VLTPGGFFAADRRISANSQGSRHADDFRDVNSAVALRAPNSPDVRQAVELRRVRAVTNALERLLDSPARRERRHPQAIAEAVSRGIDLLELLARDASRRLDGHPPALLDDAVQSLLDEVSRITSAPAPDDATDQRRGVCIRGPWQAPVDDQPTEPSEAV